jgi:hypothetical protein
MTKSTSIVLGLLAAGLGPGLVGGLLEVIPAGIAKTDFTLLLIMSLVVYPFTIFLALIFGIPLFLAFNHFHLVRWWSAILSGLIVGSAAAFVFAPSPSVWTVETFALEGAGSALLFWVVWRRGNTPNNSFKADGSAAA